MQRPFKLILVVTCVMLTAYLQKDQRFENVRFLAKNEYKLACNHFKGTIFVSVANITREEWKQLTADKAFGYRNETENQPAPKEYHPDKLQAFMLKIISFITSKFGNAIILTLFLGFLIFAFYRFFLSTGNIFFSRTRKILAPATTDDVQYEDIGTTNWGNLMEKAAQNGDNRLAVRFGYMWLLQLLQNKGYIRYRMDKTNFEYALEIQDNGVKQPFRQLSRQYEYAWYGGVKTDDSHLEQYLLLFNQLKRQIGAW